MSEALLENRDYTVIVAKTATNLQMAPPAFEARWADAQTAMMMLAEACEAFDPDGITIYMSSNQGTQGYFNHYKNVASAQIESIFAENYPPEALNLLDGLKAALDDYFTRKAAGQTKPNGAMILVLIDGEPRDRMEVVKTIVKAAEQIDRDEELGIGFLQVGDDLIARGFLTSLDHDLQSFANAKFDIVHTRLLDAIEPTCLTKFLTDIIRC